MARRVRHIAVFLLLGGAGALLASDAAAQRETYADQRQHMVQQIRQRGIEEPKLLAALAQVPRHLFVPESLRPDAYLDRPLSLGTEKTIYQAYLSALMISLLGLEGSERVLEVGTGTGYDAALLSHLAEDVYTIEIDGELGERARGNLGRLGYGNVQVRVGDGYRGWPEAAPFDGILLTVASDRVPELLWEQLKIGGRMVVAVGGFLQELQVITKTEQGREIRRVSAVRMVPMEGEIRRQR